MKQAPRPNHLLRRQRDLRGWSQDRVASRLQELGGIADGKLVGKWERGVVRPSPFYREKLCLLYGKTAEELGFLLGPTGDENQDEASRDGRQAEAQKPELPNPNEESEQQILSLTSDQLTVLKLILEEKDMTLFDPSKRETLRQIAVALGATAAHPQSLLDPEPWERLTAAQTRPSALNNAALESFEHLIGEGWKLSNIGQLEAASVIVSSFLPKILALPPRDINERLAFLASQGLRFQSMIAHHRLQVGEKLRLCQRSVEYARQANDANTLVAALNELATAYEYDEQMERRVSALQEGLFYSPQASPLLQAPVYSQNAVMLASNGRQREAEFYLGLAHEVFPDNPTLDPSYDLANSNVFVLSLGTGRVRLDMNQVSSAQIGFEWYKQHPSGTNISERFRLQIVNGLSQTAILAGDQEHYVTLLEDALVGSYALGSKKRFDEALRIFHQVPSSWRTSRRLKDVAEKYHLTELESE